MLAMVKISACKPAPPVGSVAPKHSTMGGMSDKSGGIIVKYGCESAILTENYPP